MKVDAIPDVRGLTVEQLDELARVVKDETMVKVIMNGWKVNPAGVVPADFPPGKEYRYREWYNEAMRRLREEGHDDARAGEG